MNDDELRRRLKENDAKLKRERAMSGVQFAVIFFILMLIAQIGMESLTPVGCVFGIGFFWSLGYALIEFFT